MPTVSLRRPRLVRAACVDLVSSGLVLPRDVVFEFYGLDAPLTSAADLDRGEFAGTHERMGLG